MQALRGPDQKDGLLQLPPSTHEARLLAAVLGVVTGIGLVGDQRPERRRKDG
jgi:hypothetical protein